MTVVLTLSAPAQHREEIRKSRFVVNAAPIDGPAAALAFVAQVADVSASHNCWAYRIGGNYRYFDDGEPGGTAGRPILQAIEGQDCDRVVVVVTRWFGGIKLGTGGLVRAYGGCAAACLRLADKQPWVPMLEASMDVDFAELARMRARLQELGARVVDESFHAGGAHWRLQAPQAETQRIGEAVADLTRGRVNLAWTEAQPDTTD